jgi:ATP-dependent DNA helicase RecG
MIRVDPREFWLEFPFSAAYLDSLASGRTTQETTQEQILALLREAPALTRKALADRIGLTADGIKYHFDRLRDAGRIRHVGPTKKGHWEIMGGEDR